MTKIQSPGYYGQILLQEPLSRRTLASCFFAESSLKKFEKPYKTLCLDGKRMTLMANEKQARMWFEVAEKAGYVKSGRVIWGENIKFEWSKVANQICKRLGFTEMVLSPDRGHGSMKTIQLKTSGTYDEHVDKMAEFRKHLRILNINYVMNCLIAGPCQIPTDNKTANALRTPIQEVVKP